MCAEEPKLFQQTYYEQPWALIWSHLDLANCRFLGKQTSGGAGCGACLVQKPDPYSCLGGRMGPREEAAWHLHRGVGGGSNRKYMGNHLGLYDMYRWAPMGVCSQHGSWGDGISLMGFALGCPGSGHLAAGAVVRLLVPLKASEAMPKLAMGISALAEICLHHLPATFHFSQWKNNNKISKFKSNFISTEIRYF